MSWEKDCLFAQRRPPNLIYDIAFAGVRFLDKGYSAEDAKAVSMAGSATQV